MAYFKIYYSCGCGGNEDYIEAVDLASAEMTAYEYAVEDYERYAGYHGIPSVEDVALDMFGDGDCDYDLSTLTESDWSEVEQEYEEQMQSWLDYWAEEVSEREYYYGEDEDFEEDEE